MCRQKNYTTLLKCPSIIDERFCLKGVESTSCPVSLYWLMEEEWGSQSGSSHLQGFFRLVYTNMKSFRTICDTQAGLLLLFWETNLLLYTWGPAYYRDRFLTETHSELSVSLLSFYRNRDTLNAPEPLSGMNTTPRFFTETRGTENSRLNKPSQMATYWFVISWFDIQKAQKSKV